MEPRLEAGRVTQGSKLAPGRDQRGLDGVLGQIDIAEDPHRDRQASVADHARQRVERFRVALVAPARPARPAPVPPSVAIGPRGPISMESFREPICSIPPRLKGFGSRWYHADRPWGPARRRGAAFV